MQPLPIASHPPLAGSSKGRYAFVSLGCPKNLVDSERMLGLLQLDGYQIAFWDLEALDASSPVNAQADHLKEDLAQRLGHVKEADLILAGKQRLLANGKNGAAELGIKVGEAQLRAAAPALARHRAAARRVAALPPPEHSRVLILICSALCATVCLC